MPVDFFSFCLAISRRFKHSTTSACEWY